MTNIPIADTQTGEIPSGEGEHFRPFAELLTILDHGAAHAEASRALHDLTNAVVDTGKAGHMLIKIEVKSMRGSSDQLVVTASVVSKMPRPEPAASIFYRDNGGNLTRHDPRQPEIDGLRIVEPKPSRTVTPPNGA